MLKVCVCSLRFPAFNAHTSYFSTLCHTRHDFRKQVFENKMYYAFRKSVNKSKMCFLYLQLLSETFLILRVTERYMTKNEYWSSCDVHFILARS
jgi:hypothetical protein